MIKSDGSYVSVGGAGPDGTSPLLTISPVSAMMLEGIVSVHTHCAECRNEGRSVLREAVVLINDPRFVQFIGLYLISCHARQDISSTATSTTSKVSPQHIRRFRYFVKHTYVVFECLIRFVANSVSDSQHTQPSLPTSHHDLDSQCVSNEFPLLAQTVLEQTSGQKCWFHACSTCPGCVVIEPRQCKDWLRKAR